MGRYIDKSGGFARVIAGEYVDKTGVIPIFNGTLCKEGNLYCVSRPRRFGKSYAARMLVDYYSRSCDSRSLFNGLAASKDPSFEEHLNKYPVVYIDMTSEITTSRDHGVIVDTMEERLCRELCQTYRIRYRKGYDTYTVLQKINSKTGDKFVFVIDEWDAICREFEADEAGFDRYVSWLRSIFKSDLTNVAIAGVYMTGILPIKKYNTQSALNNFKEYSMLIPGELAPFFGFSKDEVRALCQKHDMPFDEMERWYDGYAMSKAGSMFNPNSVMSAIRDGEFHDYWGKTSSFEIIRDYISMNFDGLKDDIISMLGGISVTVNPEKFQNDLVNIKSKDDVLTLLIHYGYLSFDYRTKEVRIPNYEISTELASAVEETSWRSVATALEKSDRLLKDTLAGKEEAVASAMENIHEESASILQYNDENSLSCAVTIAYYAAKNYYTSVRELPSGRGFADLAFIPVRGVDKPAMLIELKVDSSAEGAIAQIKERRYSGALKGLSGEIVLVGISYDRKTKKHECRIEKADLA